MFTPLGLFKDVPCPQGDHCSLLTCIFSHQHAVASSTGEAVLANPPRVTDDDASLKGPPAPKRRKIEAVDENDTEKRRSPGTTSSDEGRREKAGVDAASNTAGQASQQTPSRDVKSLQSTVRRVSPPPAKRAGAESGENIPRKDASNVPGRPAGTLPPREAPQESLNPRMITKPPASHTVRSAILTKLHAAMSALNDKMAQDKDSSKKSLVLSRDELVTMALDEEEKAAKDNAAIYSNVIKLRIVKLQKMSKEDWEKEVLAHLNARYYKIEPSQQPKKPEPLSTGLSTKEEIAIVSKLITPLAGREQFGYVTKAPTQQEINAAKKGVADAKGWERCDRCGGRFQVFPGRREDGVLATGGPCTYHPSKPVYPPKKQTDHITGDQREPYYPCCNETMGTSAGCTKAEYHVFKISEAKRLASVLQFEETPFQPDKGPLPPVCFDCEMGYTTLGLELIRLTAVSWPEGKELLDVLVRPMGEILDLNSRYSGIRPEHFVNAVPYGTPVPDAKDTVSEDGEVKERPFQVVESPAAARKLLFQFLQPDTPLIGHAIDNDLNACRIIHPTIIDTVLLYPHPRGGLPNRTSLKVLAKKYLDRDIQMGGDKGHDSKEDARATGDLVRVKAAEIWKELKRQGWTIKDDKLVAPPGEESKWAAGSGGVLGPGAGKKRKETA